MLTLKDEKFGIALKRIEELSSGERKAFFSEKSPDKFLLFWFFYFRSDFITLLAGFHYEWIEALFTGKNIFIEGFRGSIKTAIIRAYTVYEISNGFCKFINWQSFDDGASTRNTTNIAKKLLKPGLVEDYGEILKLKGSNKEDLQKKSVGDFDTTTGVKVMATSLGQSLRGASTDTARPDRLILDDIDTDKSVGNPEIIDKNYSKVTGESFGALTKDGPTQIIFLGNTIKSDGIVPRLRKEKSGLDSWCVFHQPLIVGNKIVWEFFTEEKIKQLKENEGKEFNKNYMLIPDVHYGTPVFNIEKVQELPELKFILSNRYKELRFYKKPCECVFGVDIAGGNSDGDHSTITAYNYNKELVLSYQGKIAPDQLGEVMEYIFKQGYFGKIIPERNSIGLAFIDKIKSGICKGYLFFEKSLDKITSKPTKKYGFSTNAKSKPLIIAKMEEWIRKGEVIEFDERTKQEIYNYYYDEKGATNALKGTHDDLVMSTALCFFGLEQPRIIKFI